jgi:FkbM family methyltransferase
MSASHLPSQLVRTLSKLLKPLLQATIYRPGSVATILRGPSKGLRYHVYPVFGLSHIYGGWEPEVLSLLASIAKPGLVAYDLGANHGLYSLLMARGVGEHGKVFSFEPMPHIRAAAEANRALNGLSNMQLVPLAVSSSVGAAEFVIGHHDGAGHLSSAGRAHEEETREGTKVQVEITTVDAFVAAGNPAPDLLKIDIEGAEGAALQGAHETLRSKRPLLMIELHTPEQDVLVGQLLLEAGYRAFRVEEPGMPAVKDMTKGYPHPDGMRGYVLAVHESKLIDARPVL